MSGIGNVSKAGPRSPPVTTMPEDVRFNCGYVARRIEIECPHCTHSAVEAARREAFHSGTLSMLREVDAALLWEINHGRKSVYDFRSWIEARFKSARAEGRGGVSTQECASCGAYLTIKERDRGVL
jgi:hypothetical protein